MAALLAPARCAISDLVCHALWSGGAPLHGDLGSGVGGGVLNRSWNSERPLVFTHVVLTKTLGIRRDREIRARITRCMEIWERGQYAGLVGDAEAEGAAREGRSVFSGEEEDNALARSFHKTVLSGKLRQAVRRATDREGGGCLLPGDKCTKTRLLVADFLREKHPDMRVPPVENPACAAFEVYEGVPKNVPLDFTEDDVTWVASKLSGAAGALGAEAMELQNWLLHFGCASEELRVVVAILSDWMANSSPHWAAYCALMACHLVALDKRTGVRPVGIGEKLRRALAKLVMRAAGEQAKTACGNFQLCAGLKAGIEGGNHAVGQRRVERVSARRGEGESEVEETTVDPEEDVNEEVTGLELNDLRIDRAVTEEEGRRRIGSGSRDGGQGRQGKRGQGRGWRESKGTGSPGVPHSGCRAEWHDAC